MPFLLYMKRERGYIMSDCSGYLGRDMVVTLSASEATSGY